MVQTNFKKQESNIANPEKNEDEHERKKYKKLITHMKKIKIKIKTQARISIKYAAIIEQYDDEWEGEWRWRWRWKWKLKVRSSGLWDMLFDLNIIDDTVVKSRSGREQRRIPGGGGGGWQGISSSRSGVVHGNQITERWQSNIGIGMMRVLGCKSIVVNEGIEKGREDVVGAVIIDIL